MQNEKHPIERQEYAVFTPPIDEMFKKVKFWIDNHIPGAFIYGLPRIGKSRALKFWVRELISEEYKEGCACFRAIMERADNSPLNVYDCLLASRDMGNPGKIPTVRANKKSLLFGRLVTLAQMTQSNRLVLIIDEAQHLNEQAYYTLCYIQSHLDDLGIRVTTILVGTNQLKAQQGIYSNPSGSQITGRFMLSNHRFRGISGLEELRYVLESYDFSSDWPIGSGNSYTQHYFPAAFAKGFKISAYCEAMWDIYDQLTVSDIEKIEIPMQHIAIPIECLFKNLGSNNLVDIKVDRKAIKTAIELSGFKEYMKSIPLV